MRRHGIGQQGLKSSASRECSRGARVHGAFTFGRFGGRKSVGSFKVVKPTLD
jgi:hypothetical protein